MSEETFAQPTKLAKAGPDTRTQLLDVGEWLVRQKGVDGFSYADLSKEVGIRKASVHYHFPSKADLLSALMVRYAHSVLTSLDEISSCGEGVVSQLEAFVDIYRLALEGGQCLCLCLALVTTQQELPSDVQKEINLFRRQVVHWLEQRFTGLELEPSAQLDGTANQEANALLALVEGAQIAARSRGKVEPFDLSVKTFSLRLNRIG